jgi:ubiquinone/menaquinone biosynthesis C-methylase UbiE
MATTSQTYIGSELEIFAHAQRWKAYFKTVFEPFIGKTVLEVGAGIGATTAALCDGSQDVWICLEPDASLLVQVEDRIRSRQLPSCCKSVGGLVSDLAPDSRFDSILYIDVLEHIEDDLRELEEASRHLAPGGYLMVLSPACPFLFSPFDRSIGHFRRYTRAGLSALTPVGCKITKILYLDSVGLFTSLSNRFLLRQQLPSHRQISFWDSWLVPLSRLSDRLSGYRVGRSIAGIWKRTD